MSNPYSISEFERNVRTNDSDQPTDNDTKKWLLINWPCAFAVNIIAPILIGWHFVTNQAFVGVLVALVSFLAVGLVASQHLPNIFKKLVFGAYVFSLTQLLPLLQFAMGLLALGIIESLRIDGQAQVGTEFHTFLAGATVTFLVGAQIAFGSMVVGFVISSIIDWIRRRFREPQTAGNSR